MAEALAESGRSTVSSGELAAGSALPVRRLHHPVPTTEKAARHQLLFDVNDATSLFENEGGTYVLTEVVGRRFTFAGFPLKVIGAHGGPTRAVAILD